MRKPQGSAPGAGGAALEGDRSALIRFEESRRKSRNTCPTRHGVPAAGPTSSPPNGSTAARSAPPGEPYSPTPWKWRHPGDLRPADCACVVAGLLHDVIGRHPDDAEVLEEYFGKDIAHLVEGTEQDQPDLLHLREEPRPRTSAR